MSGVVYDTANVTNINVLWLRWLQNSKVKSLDVKHKLSEADMQSWGVSSQIAIVFEFSFPLKLWIP